MTFKRSVDPHPPPTTRVEVRTTVTVEFRDLIWQAVDASEHTSTLGWLREVLSEALAKQLPDVGTAAQIAALNDTNNGTKAVDPNNRFPFWLFRHNGDPLMREAALARYARAGRTELSRELP